MNLLQQIQDRFRAALTGLVPDVEPFVAMIKATQDAKHGDYQANCAMALAKPLGKKPRDIAQDLIGRLNLGDFLEKPEIAGPGFINLRLQSAWLAKRVQAIAGDERLGVGTVEPAKTYVIDYSSPNVAKPLHVGHLRSTIIGDALTRLLRFLGHTVITDNHLGDWGTQFGILLYGYKTLRDEWAYQENPVRELARLYVVLRETARVFEILSNVYHKNIGNDAFQAEFRSDPIKVLARTYVMGLKDLDQFDNEDVQGKVVPNPITDCFRAETAKLHHGDPENIRLWEQFMPHCLKEIHHVYEKLGILPFDFEHGESFYNSMLPGVVNSLLQKGVAETGDDDAIIIKFGDPNAQIVPIAMIRKRDGAFTYTTSDLATIQYRLEQFKPQAMLYVVDFRQSQHFANLFEAARRWGVTDLPSPLRERGVGGEGAVSAIELTHISFGSVLNRDGRPISTRKGDGTELIDLINKAIAIGLEKYEASHADRKAQGHDVPDLTDDAKRAIAETVGIGAIKYADLSQNRTSDYKFDYDKMLATEGNTATYMQYAYARNRSIFRKADVDPRTLRANPPPVAVDTPFERALAIQLLRFEEALLGAAAEYQPSGITAYLWDLAKTYSGFFQNCPVIKADTDAIKQSRLLLCDLTARVLQQSLSLLGINTVERM